METPLRLIEEFDKAARAAGLDYLIIGGFAASFWGTPRFTGDVDVAIRGADFATMQSIAATIGYSQLFLHPQSAFAHYGSSDQTGFRLDLMLVDDDTWSKLRQDVVFGDLGGPTPYPIVSALHFIAMKLHSAKQHDRTEYHKDLNDIVETMLAQKIELGDLEAHGILQKHGTERTIQLLKDMLDVRRRIG